MIKTMAIRETDKTAIFCLVKIGIEIIEKKLSTVTTIQNLYKSMLNPRLMKK